MKKRHWIEDAIQNPGSFKAAARRAGESTAEYAREEDDAPGKLGRRARLAEALMELRKKKA